MDLTDPTTAALVAVEAAERTGRGYALYGGLLLAAYGEPRETRDVDLAFTSLDAAAIRAALEALGAPSSPATGRTWCSCPRIPSRTSRTHGASRRSY